MTVFAIPNRPVAGESEDISKIIADFDALIADLNGNIENENIKAGAAIAYSKLNLTGALVDADVAAGAAIAITKIDPGTALQQIRTNAGGTALEHFTPAAAAQEYDVLSKVTAAVTVVNTVTETDLLNYTVPANTLGTDKRVEAVLIGDWLQNSGAARPLPIFRVKFGGTTYIATAAVSEFAANASRKPWEIRVCLAASGATNTQIVQAEGKVGGQVSSAGGVALTTGLGEGYITVTALQNVSGFRGINTGGAIDSTAAQALVVSVELPAAHASLEWKLWYAAVQVIG